MSTVLRYCAVALSLLAAPATADVLLDGFIHIGNCNDTTDIDSGTPGLQTACDAFTPRDPQSRNSMFNTLIAFHLTTTTTIDKVVLNNPVSLDGKLNVWIQPMGSAPIFRSGTLSGSTWDLVPDLVLSPGYYTIWPDGGCSAVNGAGTFFYANCAGSGDNDFSFSSITLVSLQTSTSRMLIQRRHPGNDAVSPTDNDIDDDYDEFDTGSPYYPDISEPHPMDIGFNLNQNRRISEIRFYRLRDVDNAPPNQSSLSIDGQQVGVFVDTGDPLELNPTVISTNFLALAGNHILRVTLGVISGLDVDSFSWDSIIIRSVDVAPSGVLGSFNAVDIGQAALNGIIKTKIANKNHDLDIYAINALGSGINTTYAGTVNVELLDAPDNSGTLDIYGCRSNWGSSVAYFLGSVTFAGGDNGKKTLSVTPYPNAVPVARVRVTDPATGARGCSTDAFAIRPKEFQVVASDDDASTAGLTRSLPTGGYSSTSTPIHKAGQPFTLQVTPLGEGGAAVSGYTGQPTVSAIVLELGTVLGNAAMTAAWSVSGGVLRNDSLTYSEVGAVRLRVEDTSFADIDVADSSVAERSIENDDVKVGRFVPDHFTVTKNTLDPACGTFSYIGQNFGYGTGAATLTAANALGTPTLGYTGMLGFSSKLTSIPQATFGVYDDPAIAGTPTLNVPGGAHTVSDLGNGTGRILLPSINVIRPTTLIGSFSADIGIEFPTFTDSDGVAIAPAGDSPIIMGTANSGTGAPFINPAHNQMRYGRLFLESSYGSERADLNMALRTEYFDGVSFVPGPDTCTTLVATTATLTTPVVGGQTATVAPVVTGPPSPWLGPWTVTLSAPGVPGAAVVDVDLSAAGPYPWLLDDNTDGDGLYNNNPRATANFGLYNRSQDNRIYQREVFR